MVDIYKLKLFKEFWKERKTTELYKIIVLIVIFWINFFLSFHTFFIFFLFGNKSVFVIENSVEDESNEYIIQFLKQFFDKSILWKSFITIIFIVVNEKFLRKLFYDHIISMQITLILYYIYHYKKEVIRRNFITIEISIIALTI